MTAQKGKDLLLKMTPMAQGASRLSPVCGRDARVQRGGRGHHRRRFGRALARASDGAGVRPRASPAAASSRTPPPTRRCARYFFNGTVRDWQVIVPELGTVEGPFRSRASNMPASTTARSPFDMGLESAGALSPRRRGVTKGGSHGQSASR